MDYIPVRRTVQMLVGRSIGFIVRIGPDPRPQRTHTVSSPPDGRVDVEVDANLHGHPPSTFNPTFGRKPTYLVLVSRRQIFMFRRA